MSNYRTPIPFILPLLLALAGTACGNGDEGGEDEVGDSGAANDQCLSGTAWVGGNSESSRMHPGLDCLACHATNGVDEVTLAGTVYDGANELDDCYGVEGVTIQITDSTNKVTELTSNAAGNFLLLDASITPPYTAKLLYEGRERAMVSMQTETSCNSCHTEMGANAAPGRILAP